MLRQSKTFLGLGKVTKQAYKVVLATLVDSFIEIIYWISAQDVLVAIPYTMYNMILGYVLSPKQDQLFNTVWSILQTLNIKEEQAARHSENRLQVQCEQW